MAIKTTLEKIEEVQDAITKCLNTQSYTIGDASVQRAKLRDLRAYEADLLTQYNKENGNTPMVAQGYFGNAGD
jgi:hypothetical protein